MSVKHWTPTFRFAFSAIAILVNALWAQPADELDIPRAADHHLHIRSLDGAWILNQQDQALGETDASNLKAITAAQAIAALDAAGINHGLVLSNAYMFGSPASEVANEYAKVQAENDYVAEQIMAYPGRLTGACSFNPMADYAIREMQRCSQLKQMSVIKLHLGNSNVDLLNPQHVTQLRKVFQEATRLQSPVIIHLRNRQEGYGAADAQIFIDQVLSVAPQLPVQIAHMGGWGGYDEATDAAMGAFVRAIQSQRLSCEQISFDLGAVVFQPEAAGDNLELAQQVRDSNAKLSSRINEIGVECVVYASDWPSWPPVRDRSRGIDAYAKLVIEQLALRKDQLKQIFTNVNPLLKTAFN